MVTPYKTAWAAANGGIYIAGPDASNPQPLTLVAAQQLLADLTQAIAEETASCPSTFVMPGTTRTVTCQAVGPHARHQISGQAGGWVITWDNNVATIPGPLSG